MSHATKDRIVSPIAWATRQASLESTPFEEERRLAAKAAYATSRFDGTRLPLLVTGVRPKAGDLVLARVTRLHQHKRLETPTGRRAHLHVGDEILVCYGNRYAPDQFEALVPEDLGPCHLVAAGGIAARVTVRHGGTKPATEIEPIGLVAGPDGTVANLMDVRLPVCDEPPVPPFVVAVVGTSMNAGKTTTAAACIHGLSRSGLRVGAAKVTGTGAGGDRWQLHDAGARAVLDFTDVGHATTHKIAPQELVHVFSQLVAHLASRGMEAIVVEVADGLLQEETAALLRSPVFARRVGGLLFAAADALGAVAGVEWLQREGLPLLGVCGLVTRSPLACRETEQRIDVPILTRRQVAGPAFVGRQIRALAGLERAGHAC